jgi:hypothetical protein
MTAIQPARVRRDLSSWGKAIARPDEYGSWHCGGLDHCLYLVYCEGQH